MFIFDILKQDGRRVQALAALVAAGLFVLLAGLWWVQVVCSKQFEADLEKHSFRHVRTPALRGKIIDCTTNILADDQPHYNAILHLEELQPQFVEQFKRMAKEYGRAHPELINAKGRLNLPTSVRTNLQTEANCAIVSNITYCVSMSLQEPRALNAKAFFKHYRDHPYVPFQIVPDLTPRQVAIFAEQWSGAPALELETQPVRNYPYKSLAANLLGYVRPRRDDSASEKYSFDMLYYQGDSGLEYVYDDKLCGQPGDNSVLVNNQSYRQREEVERPDLPGNDLYLTIDLDLQKAAERALASVGLNVRGAVVVMDPRNGDILALVSAPSFDPNIFVRGPTPQDMERLDDRTLTPQINRAIYGAYPPGSVFKIITAIACLETGLNPDEVFQSQGYYQPAGTKRRIGDEAAPGPYNLERAFFRSSNTYFIVMGKPRIHKILEVAKRFHLGEKTGFSPRPRQEAAGNVPGPDKVGPSLGMSIPDICIGQEITITPLQMAGMISVIANGGTLYVPRVVSYARSSDTGEKEELVERGRVRDHVQLNPADLDRIRQIMLADTEHGPDNLGLGGTAYPAFHRGGPASLGNFRVAAKTGTAEVKSPGSPYNKITWFASYGPFEDPRYVVIVMVEDGASGGRTCAPPAELIYEAILKREHLGGRASSLAHN